jgi:hypothetical protein
MPLIDCPACGRQISTVAEACPQCGHPNQPPTPAATGPTCYACPNQATTRCQRCNAQSCIEHLQSIYMYRVGSYELRCQACVSSATAWNALTVLLAVLSAIAVVLWGKGVR